MMMYYTPKNTENRPVVFPVLLKPELEELMDDDDSSGPENKRDSQDSGNHVRYY